MHFDRLDEGTDEDFEVMRRVHERNLAKLPDLLLSMLSNLKGDAAYPVDRLEHSVQTATRAMRAGADEELIVCALFHDVGETLGPLNHGQVDAAILRPFVSEQNHWVLAHHAIFQTYFYPATSDSIPTRATTQGQPLLPGMHRLHDQLGRGLFRRHLRLGAPFDVRANGAQRAVPPVGTTRDQLRTAPPYSTAGAGRNLPVMAGIGPFSRRLRDRPDDQLPLGAGPVSNGEFVPAAAGDRDRSVNELIRASIDDAARRTGVDRRRFLQGAGAVAASLAVFEFAGCASPSASHPQAASHPRSKGGTFKVPPPEDTAACQDALTGSEFVLDVHTHHVIPTGPWVDDSPSTTSLVLSMLPAGCTDATQLDCVDRASYLHDIFLASDTTMAVLTDVPNSGPSNAPIPFPEALRTQQITAGLTDGGASRLLVENIIAPNVGPVSATLEEMTGAVSSGPPAAFKVYTAWSPSGQGYSLLDPTIGLPTVQHAHDLGVKVFVAHKGLPLVNFDPIFNHPDDIVAVSRQFPDMQFVVYHAAWDPNHVEGPYDPSASIGIDTLLTSLDQPQRAAQRQRVGGRRHPVAPTPHHARSGRPRFGQAARPCRHRTGHVGHRRHLVREP